MILIYSDAVAPRLEYISRLIFREILRTGVSFTTDAAAFRESPLPKINYSNTNIGEGLFLKAGSLLFSKMQNFPDSGIPEPSGVEFPFKTSDDSFLPFDPLASSFYLVSRYEEYIPGVRDKHGRYPYSRSLLSKLGMLETPVVNRWAQMMGAAMAEKYPTLAFPKPEMQFLLTIDIDNAWAVKHKGLTRTAGAFLKSAAGRDLLSPACRISILCGKRKDPYDTYDYLKESLRGHEQETRIFFLMDHRSRHDRQVSWKNRAFRTLVKDLADTFPAGIHPSYRSSEPGNPFRVRVESGRLQEITGREIRYSRQHYLRLNLPHTYRMLSEAGIREDYSMGYPDTTGFRAGICTPHYFYDLEREEETTLRVVPFQIMDVTMNRYLGLSPSEAIRKTDQLAAEIRQTGGLFSVIWHNESLSDQGCWKGWRTLFEYMIHIGFGHEH